MVCFGHELKIFQTAVLGRLATDSGEVYNDIIFCKMLLNI
jgi:hypothetical protein